MRIDIVTVLPEMVAPMLDHSIVKRARDRGLVTINVVNLRDFTTDRHRTTDDIPYGGGGGMVMKIEPIARALETLTRDGPYLKQEDALGHEEAHRAAAVTTDHETVLCGVPSDGWDAASTSSGIIRRPRIVLTDPRGQRFTQKLAQQWAREPHLILICGHYEGVDQRVRQHLVTDEVSIGDYILTGGELPALVIADALTRLQPGALGDEQAPDKDTFAADLLEYPHYTRPREYNGWRVPDILLCGHHALIERWRYWHQLRATRDLRPDLFAGLNLTAKDLALLQADEPIPPADPKAARRDARGASRDADTASMVETTSNLTVNETVHDNEKHEVTDGSGTANHT